MQAPHTTQAAQTQIAIHWSCTQNSCFLVGLCAKQLISSEASQSTLQSNFWIVSSSAGFEQTSALQIFQVLTDGLLLNVRQHHLIVPFVHYSPPIKTGSKTSNTNYEASLLCFIQNQNETLTYQPHLYPKAKIFHPVKWLQRHIPFTFILELSNTFLASKIQFLVSLKLQIRILLLSHLWEVYNWDLICG